MGLPLAASRTINRDCQETADEPLPDGRDPIREAASGDFRIIVYSA
jgi:hypothetical protein